MCQLLEIIRRKLQGTALFLVVPDKNPDLSPKFQPLSAALMLLLHSQESKIKVLNQPWQFFLPRSRWEFLWGWQIHTQSFEVFVQSCLSLFVAAAKGGEELMFSGTQGTKQNKESHQHRKEELMRNLNTAEPQSRLDPMAWASVCSVNFQPSASLSWTQRNQGSKKSNFQLEEEQKCWAAHGKQG